MSPALKTAAPKASWTQAEAFLGLLTLVAVCDGQKAANRLETVHALAKRSPFLKPLGEKGVIRLHSDVVERIGAAGPNAFEEACAALPAHMRESLYAQCMDVLAMTAPPSTEDQNLVSELRRLLSIEATRAQEIESVIFLKNQY